MPEERFTGPCHQSGSHNGGHTAQHSKGRAIVSQGPLPPHGWPQIPQIYPGRGGRLPPHPRGGTDTLCARQQDTPQPHLPAHRGLRGLTASGRSQPAILPSAASPLSARSRPDPGYKYLPLHPGRIRLTQATMVTAFLPPTQGSCTALVGRGLEATLSQGKATPSPLLETTRKGGNTRSTRPW